MPHNKKRKHTTHRKGVNKAYIILKQQHTYQTASSKRGIEYIIPYCEFPDSYIEDQVRGEVVVHLPQGQACQANQIEDDVLLFLQIGYQADNGHVDEAREEFKVAFCASHAIVANDISLEEEV